MFYWPAESLEAVLLPGDEHPLVHRLRDFDILGLLLQVAYCRVEVLDDIISYQGHVQLTRRKLLNELFAVSLVNRRIIIF